MICSSMPLSQSELEMMIPVVAIVFGCLVAVVAIISRALRKASQTRQIEQTRREVAAYVAEGSMDPDEAERLLKAGQANRPDA